MDAKIRQETLFKVVCEVFATAAFAVVDSPEEEPATTLKDSGEILCARLEFTGPFCGVMAIAAPREFAKIVGTNMLCLEDDVADIFFDRYDPLKELLNMVCGSLLPALAGPKHEFAIGAPEEVAFMEYVKMTEDKNDSRTLIDLHIESFPVELLMLANPESIEMVLEA
jgi:hypothetical protein